MQDLRHLYLNEVYHTRFPDWSSGCKGGCLTCLRTLWGAFVDKDTCVKDGLDTLLDIRKLGLSCCSSTSKSSNMSKQLIAVDRWITKLKFLECLRLKSRHGDGRAADLHLSSLDAFVVRSFLESLTDVTLSWSGLNMDPMEVLGKLPKLQILRLLAQSVVHTRMHCSGRSFRVLKVVYIWKLEKLEEWEVEEGAMPCLEGVEIRSCQKLERLPGGLGHVSKCRLTDMPERFIDQTMVKQPQLWAKIELGHQDN